MGLGRAALNALTLGHRLEHRHAALAVGRSLGRSGVRQGTSAGHSA
jgi:hypothetical protein